MSDKYYVIKVPKGTYRENGFPDEIVEALFNGLSESLTPVFEEARKSVASSLCRYGEEAKKNKKMFADAFNLALEKSYSNWVAPEKTDNINLLKEANFLLEKVAYLATEIQYHLGIIKISGDGNAILTLLKSIENINIALDKYKKD